MAVTLVATADASCEAAATSDSVLLNLCTEKLNWSVSVCTDLASLRTVAIADRTTSKRVLAPMALAQLVVGCGQGARPSCVWQAKAQPSFWFISAWSAAVAPIPIEPDASTRKLMEKYVGGADEAATQPLKVLFVIPANCSRLFDWVAV